MATFTQLTQSTSPSFVSLKSVISDSSYINVLCTIIVECLFSFYEYGFHPDLGPFCGKEMFQ
jgi:hypothetical protein